MYGNCFGVTTVPGSVQATSEPLVQRACRGIEYVEDLPSLSSLEGASLAAWRLVEAVAQTCRESEAPHWSRRAGDIARWELARSVAVPAHRGRAIGVAMRELGIADHADELVAVLSQSPAGTLEYLTAERAEARGVAAGTGLRYDERFAMDPRDMLLLQKYRATRDSGLADLISQRITSVERLVTRAVCALSHRRSSLLAIEYSSVRAFLDHGSSSGTGRPRGIRLVRTSPRKTAVPGILARGDLVFPRSLFRLGRPGGPSPTIHHRNLPTQHPDWIAGLEGAVAAILDRHAQFAETVGPRITNFLQREKVRAVLVPFIGPPDAMLTLLAARDLGLPVFASYDGVEVEPFDPGGPMPDVCLGWSATTSSVYLMRNARRSLITGNPRMPSLRGSQADQASRSPAHRILIATAGYAPTLTETLRSRPEAFAGGVIQGLHQSGVMADGHRATITIKPHPADSAELQRRLFDQESFTVVDGVDIVDLFDDHDILIAPFSTAIVDAWARGLPAVIFEPREAGVSRWTQEPWLAANTARTPEELASLIAQGPTYPEADQLRRLVGPGGPVAVASMWSAIGPALL